MHDIRPEKAGKVTPGQFPGSCTGELLRTDRQ